MKIVNNGVRDHSIDMIKAMAMFGIIISHSLPFYGDTNLPSYVNLNMASRDYSHFIMSAIRYLGQQGNIIYIICSAWFLIDKDDVKLKKIITIVVDNFFFSIAFLVLFLLTGLKIGIGEIIIQFFPILFGNNWFVGCYILLYCIHPALNLILKSLGKHKCMIVLITISILYFGIAFLIGGAFYFTPFMGFVLIYFIVGYVKLYTNNNQNYKKNIIQLIGSLCAFLTLLVITNELGLRIQMFSDKMLRWAVLCNPFLLNIGISLFNLLRQYKMKNELFYLISSNSMLIYIIHENILVREYFKPLLWLYIYNKGGYHVIFLWILVVAIIFAIISLIIAIFYKRLLGGIQKIVVLEIEKIVRNIYNSLFNILKKIE